MTATLFEERVLVPNGPKIKALRSGRGLTVEEAIHQAKSLGIPLTGNTLRNAERGANGCRLVTLGWIMQFYGVTDLDTLILNIPDATTPAGKRPPRPRARRG